MSLSRRISLNTPDDEHLDAVAREMHKLGAAIDRLRKWRSNPQYADILKREVPVLNVLSALLVQTVHSLKE